MKSSKQATLWIQINTFETPAMLVDDVWTQDLIALVGQSTRVKTPSHYLPFFNYTPYFKILSMSTLCSLSSYQGLLFIYKTF